MNPSVKNFNRRVVGDGSGAQMVEVGGLKFKGEPQRLTAIVSFEGDRIIIDRSEFPLDKYSSIDNPSLLENAAALMRKDIESGRLVGTRYVQR